jgi:phosphatidylglycerophosphatase A
MILFLAQGFGVGRIPFAPGTFGSLVGLAWVAALLATRRYELFLLGALLGVGLSVWLCGAAEKILKQKDPSSVVLDEIVALPFCFLPWITAVWLKTGKLPALETFFSGRSLLAVGAIFILFRVFDIWKPWPIRQSQRLPGGWGVTVDDLLAAGYVALLSLPFVVIF